MSTTAERAAVRHAVHSNDPVNDLQRVHEVRRYCQISPSLASWNRGTPPPDRQHAAGATRADAALAALLRCLVMELDADIAWISLLDDHTQYFLAGAERSARSAETRDLTKWYGCDTVTHHGGLCERTITIDHEKDPSAIYEELNMAENSRTQDLPFVDGTIAEFKHYAGAPIVSIGGFTLGSVFIMNTTASNGLAASQRQYLTKTACDVGEHLSLAVQALDGERAARFQLATAALLQTPDQPLQETPQPVRKSGLNQRPSLAGRVYRHAATLLREALGLSEVCFQNIASHRSELESASLKGEILATSHEAEDETTSCLDDSHIDRILQIFPQGGMIQFEEGASKDCFIRASHGPSKRGENRFASAVGEAFPGARQILFVPLFDFRHNRTAAICIGWSKHYKRVYTPETDLLSMSTFCLTAISQVLRLESQRLEEIKSDFLGSISHEMRSPLHNTLGNLELLLGSGCSGNQRELAVNARFGATELLGTIDKILQYTEISAGDEEQPNGDRNATKDIGRRRPLRIGSRLRQEADVKGHVDLIGLCEEIVEDVTTRMRVQEAIKSPRMDATCNDLTRFPSSQVEHRGTNGESIPMVLFDTISNDNLRLPGNTELRTILENLLHNAVKYSDPDCCVRVCLSLVPAPAFTHAELIVSDCGCGMTQDFVEHNLFVPFAQQDSLRSGVGLGLSIVKGSLDGLGGTIRLETDQRLGTTATVSVEVSALTADVTQEDVEDKSESNSDEEVPRLPKRIESDLPVLNAWFYTPSTWTRRRDERAERSVDLLYQSLAHTLSQWSQPRLSMWQRQRGRELPDVLFVTQQDLEAFKQECDEDFAQVKRVLICPGMEKDGAENREKIDEAAPLADALIVGAVLPSKLWKAVTFYFPHLLPAGVSAYRPPLSSHQRADDPFDGPLGEPLARESPDEKSVGVDSLHNEVGSDTAGVAADSISASDNARKGLASLSLESNEDVTDASTTEDPDTESAAPGNVMQENGVAKSRPTNDGRDVERSSQIPSAAESPTHPRMLLVDDNNINLRMLTMFVKKCGIPPSYFKSVAGGREAVAAFQEVYESKDDSAFDIVLMDLSMPEVSGFEATASIRSLEAASNGRRRTYIVALSGLVSSKDRNAAYEAGVDDYVTKPAGASKVQEVIDRWAANR